MVYLLNYWKIKLGKVGKERFTPSLLKLVSLFAFLNAQQLSTNYLKLPITWGDIAEFREFLL